MSLSEAHLQAARRDARHTLGREAERCPSIAFVPSGIAGPASAKGDIPRPGRGRPRRRRGARFRGGLLAAAELADAAPATALTPHGRCCARLPRCPYCPEAIAHRAPYGPPITVGLRAKQPPRGSVRRSGCGWEEPRPTLRLTVASMTHRHGRPLARGAGDEVARAPRTRRPRLLRLPERSRRRPGVRVEAH
jgi:hypothetical protein